ncbi:15974_t:CDS:2, partial [Racocetra persica]
KTKQMMTNANCDSLDLSSNLPVLMSNYHHSNLTPLDEILLWLENVKNLKLGFNQTHKNMFNKRSFSQEDESGALYYSERPSFSMCNQNTTGVCFSSLMKLICEKSRLPLGQILD